MKQAYFVFLCFIVKRIGSTNITYLPFDDDLPPRDSLPSNYDFPQYNDFNSRPTRRILRGHLAGETRPYMVYLRTTLDKHRSFDNHWLCGGVIIDPRHILTSAACIEDVGNFYVVSGTHKFVPPNEHGNQCIINGAKRAVWKCIPKSNQQAQVLAYCPSPFQSIRQPEQAVEVLKEHKPAGVGDQILYKYNGPIELLTYFFDGDAFDNIRWMVGDIAVVKVDDEFNFQRKIKGCDYIPKMIEFNNRSATLERSGTNAYIAGWGATERFIDLDADTRHLRYNSNELTNSIELLETDVVLISKRSCKTNWEERYHFIINEEMICTKGIEMSLHNDNCQNRGASCEDIVSSNEDYSDENRHIRRMMSDHQNLIVHTANHRSRIRRSRTTSGGFCENDHGGPLIVGQGKAAVVIGIMSACLAEQVNHKCYGPFLYTSVYKYKRLISCAIDMNLMNDCQSLLRSSNTLLKKVFFNWQGSYLRQRDSEERVQQQIQRPRTDEKRKHNRIPRTGTDEKRQNNQIPRPRTEEKRENKQTSRPLIEKKSKNNQTSRPLTEEKRENNQTMRPLIEEKQFPLTEETSQTSQSRTEEKKDLQPDPLFLNTTSVTAEDPLRVIKNVIMRRFYN